MGKFKVEYREGRRTDEIEADTFMEQEGSYVFVDRRTNQAVVAIPRELVQIVKKIED